MAVFSTIVVGTDGSDNAEAAVRVLSDLVRADPGTDVHIVAAYDPWAAAQLRSIAAEIPADIQPRLRVESIIDGRLARAQAFFAGTGTTPSIHAVEQDPTDALLHFAERLGADLLVVGSRGEGLVRRALHGSVATKALHEAPCAVMVVKDDSID